MITLVDVSANNGPVVHDPVGAVAAVKAAGHRGIVVKATEGRSYQWDGARAVMEAAIVAGLDVGLYHFAKPDARPDDAARECHHFLDVAEQLPSVTLPPWLDLEKSDDGFTGSALVKWATYWCCAHQDAIGITPCIYTGPGFWGGRLGHTQELTAWPLVVAAYNNHATPPTLGKWKPVLWQFTASAPLAGFPGHVTDMSRWCGTDDEYAAFRIGV